MIVKRGTVILEESPFVYVLCPSQRNERCDHCFELTSIRKCSGCHYVGYCDRTCQRASWQFHKDECPRLRRIPKHLILPNAARVIARIIMKLKRGGDMEKGWYAKSNFRIFKDLMSHYSDIKEDERRLEHLLSLKNVLADYLGEELIPNGAELMGIYGRMVINSFNILDSEMNQIGTGIYLAASTIDHSCRPNSVAIFRGTTIYIRATEDIPDFTWNKIRISYIELLKSKMERQTELKKQYFFLCDCLRCSDAQELVIETALLCPNYVCCAAIPQPQNKQDPVTCPSCEEVVSDQVIKSYFDTMDFTKDQHQAMKDVAYLDICKLCLSKQDNSFYPLNIYRTKTLDLAFESAIKLEKWKDAINLGHLLTPGYRRYCGQMHPLLGIHHLRLGKIHLHLDQVQMALRELNKADDVLSVTHGKSHPLYKEELLPLLLQARYGDIS